MSARAKRVSTIQLYDRELAEARTMLELAVAERDAAIAMSQALVKIIDREGGFIWPQDQATVREAKALLASSGRPVNE